MAFGSYFVVQIQPIVSRSKADSYKSLPNVELKLAGRMGLASRLLQHVVNAFEDPEGHITHTSCCAATQDLQAPDFVRMEASVSVVAFVYWAVRLTVDSLSRKTVMCC